MNHKVETVTAGRRVVIAEDSVLLLAGLTKLLESAGFEVAATAADAAALLAAVERERPDVVIAPSRSVRWRSRASSSGGGGLPSRIRRSPRVTGRRAIA